jgi:hypothetical protein
MVQNTLILGIHLFRTFPCYTLETLPYAHSTVKQRIHIFTFSSTFQKQYVATAVDKSLDNLDKSCWIKAWIKAWITSLALRTQFLRWRHRHLTWPFEPRKKQWIKEWITYFNPFSYSSTPSSSLGHMSEITSPTKFQHFTTGSLLSTWGPQQQSSTPEIHQNIFLSVWLWFTQRVLAHLHHSWSPPCIIYTRLYTCLIHF